MHNVCVHWSECLLNFEYMFRCAYEHTRTSTHPRQHASTHAQTHTRTHTSAQAHAHTCCHPYSDTQHHCAHNDSFPCAAAATIGNAVRLTIAA